MYIFADDSPYYRHCVYKFTRPIGRFDYLFFEQDAHELISISFNAYMVMIMDNQICSDYQQAHDEQMRRFMNKLDNLNEKIT